MIDPYMDDFIHLIKTRLFQAKYLLSFIVMQPLWL